MAALVDVQNEVYSVSRFARMHSRYKETENRAFVK
jgi:hypothetical protein